MSTHVVGIHADATRLDIHDLVARLNGTVGATVVRAITGRNDRATPLKWAKPDGPQPHPKAEQQLRLAYRAWAYLAHNEGDSVAFAWLMGANPMLDERTPVTAIRELESASVMGAVKAFVAGANAA